MLTSSFLFSTHRPAIVPPNLPNKDISIFEHTLEPVPKLNTSYKKSSTRPNCLAISATHIFAAQADKAVVQVYNRDKGTKEADVPFGEKIASCCFVESRNGDGIGALVLGMEGGRLILWEICTGRQVSTPPAHLEAITCLAVDSTRNFLLSGSSDHNIHVWKLVDLLSFSTDSRTPYTTFSEHRGTITSLVTSHSQMSDSYALSASEDKTVLLWNFRNATRLVTLLVSSVPQSLALDPADRALYIGFEDSIQFVDLHNISFNDPKEAMELGENSKWTNEPPILCLSITYDGTNLLTGYQNGKVFKRTTPRGAPALVFDAHLPVSNILALDPTGFRNQRQATAKPVIVKPKLDMAVRNDESLIPDRYELNSIFNSFLSQTEAEDTLFLDFDELLEHSSFPDELLHAALTLPSKSNGLELDEAGTQELEKLKQENQAASANIDNLRREVDSLRQAERARQISKKLNRIRKSKALEAMRKKAMGETNGDIVMEENEQPLEDVSSDTDG